VRVLIASGALAGASVAQTLVRFRPSIAAVTALSPADACGIADQLSLRYALQCWDDDRLGKAIFWTPSLEVLGVYRLEFVRRAHDDRSPLRGLLRVTLRWEGRALNVLSAQLAHDRAEADWQAAQIAREIENAAGATLALIDDNGAAIDALAPLVDASASAPWRTVWFAGNRDPADAVRAAFGLPSGIDAGSAGAQPCGLHLFTSGHFAVLRVLQVDGDPAAACAAVAADLVSTGERDEGGDDAAATAPSRRESRIGA
jgi:hypothetical protein